LLLRRKTSVNADVIFNFVFENRERAPSETFIILLISSINMVEKYQKITVGGLLIKDDKVLVVRRSSAEPYLTGYYELPGGKVDFGDHPKESLEREFMEEVNLKVIALHPYRVFTYISDKGNRHTVELVYFVQLDDDIKNIKLSEEHDDFKWISAEEVDDLQISDEIKMNIKVGFKEIEVGALSKK